jgi:hypothetical protein
MTQRIYSTATDAYSFGILLWEISSDGEIPFGELPTLAEVATAVLKRNARPAIPSTTPREYGRLMTSLWHTDPTERPSMSDAFATLQSF